MDLPLSSGPSTVSIRLGKVAPLKASRLRPIPIQDYRVYLAPKRVVLEWPREARIAICSGKKITVECLSRLHPDVLRLMVLGPALGVLLEQRGHLVLHASAVNYGNKAVAFLGASGAGKSTLAGALCRKGFKLHADNLLALRIRRRMEALPGLSKLKLCRDTAHYFGYRTDKLEPIEPGSNKRYVPHAPSSLSLPVKRMYLLAPGRRSSIGRLSSKQSLLALIRHSYGTSALLQGKRLSRHFFSCAALLKKVELRLLTRGRDLEALPSLLSLICKDLGS